MWLCHSRSKWLPLWEKRSLKKTRNNYSKHDRLPKLRNCVSFWRAFDLAYCHVRSVWRDSRTVTWFSPELVVDPVVVKFHYDHKGATRAIVTPWTEISLKGSSYKPCRPLAPLASFLRLFKLLKMKGFMRRLANPYQLHGIWPVGEDRVMEMSYQNSRPGKCGKTILKLELKVARANFRIKVTSPIYRTSSYMDKRQRKFWLCYA